MQKSKTTYNSSMISLEPGEVLSLLKAAEGARHSGMAMMGPGYKHGMRASEICRSPSGRH